MYEVVVEEFRQNVHVSRNELYFAEMWCLGIVTESITADANGWQSRAKVIVEFRHQGSEGSEFLQDSRDLEAT